MTFPITNRADRDPVAGVPTDATDPLPPTPPPPTPPGRESAAPRDDFGAAPTTSAAARRVAVLMGRRAPSTASPRTAASGSGATSIAAPASTAPGGRGAAGGELASRVVTAARAEVDRHVREDAGENEDAAGRIREYRLASGRDRPPEAYCADFVSFVFREAGHPIGPGGHGLRAAEGVHAWLERTGAWRPNDGSYTPQPGDVVVFHNDRDPARGSHVGVVERVDPNGTLHTIEGNTEDRGEEGVMRRHYTRERVAARVLGFGHVQ
jgi:cell wall-associated NlpC family hydrolase